MAITTQISLEKWSILCTQNKLLTLDHHLYPIGFSVMILGELQRNNWFWIQIKIVFYPWYKKTLNYFTKLLQGYMNLVIVLVAILYQKVNKRRLLRNIEKCQGSLILLIQKNGSVSANHYEADKSCHIG